MGIKWKTDKLSHYGLETWEDCSETKIIWPNIYIAKNPQESLRSKSEESLETILEERRFNNIEYIVTSTNIIYWKWREEERVNDAREKKIEKNRLVGIKFELVMEGQILVGFSEIWHLKGIKWVYLWTIISIGRNNHLQCLDTLIGN